MKWLPWWEPTDSVPKVESIQDVVRTGLCISCGACVSAAPQGSMRMVLDKRGRIYVPEILDPSAVSGRGPEFEACPGVGLPLGKLSADLLGEGMDMTLELGRYRLAIAARSTDSSILAEASSGGVMTEIAAHLLEKGYVDGVTIARFEYGPNGLRPVSLIARSREDLITGQGSKYCPTLTNLLVRECIAEGGRYLFSGTPCQVGALRLAMSRQPEAAKVFPYTMGNFCGGYRDYRLIDWLISKHGFVPSEVKFFRFRGGGQPGTMVIETRNGRRVSEPYPNYARGSGIPKLKRCTFCIDGTAELADFACGDAWLDRYMCRDTPWSIILARSEFAESIVNEMSHAGLLVTEPVSFEDVVRSQRSNLTSKKYRQRRRMAVCRATGMALPKWDVELPEGTTSYLHEIKVLMSKRLSRTPAVRWLKKVAGRG